jgi:hypothetical protein
MSEEEVKVGNFNKPTKKPVPGKVATDASTPPTVEELNEKLDTVLKHLQAIDWKIWVYLKANNYID